MRALSIQHGDLALGPRGYAEVTGRDKIIQDLRVATLTPYGSNNFHPTWGCTLDSKIGSPQGTQTAQLIMNEVKRIVGILMAQQQSQLQTAQSYGYVSPYGNADLIAAITSISATASYDTISVSCDVSTASNESVTLIASVSPTGVIGVVS